MHQLKQRASAKSPYMRHATAQRTFEMVSAGLHCSFRMSRQMLPWLLMLGWYTCRQHSKVYGC